MPLPACHSTLSATSSVLMGFKVIAPRGDALTKCALAAMTTLIKPHRTSRDCDACSGRLLVDDLRLQVAGGLL